MLTTHDWLRSGAAASALGISKSSLHRLHRQGVLPDGSHCRPGPLPGSGWFWQVEACREAIAQHTATSRGQG
jgi:hypothetical protein